MPANAFAKVNGKKIKWKWLRVHYGSIMLVEEYAFYELSNISYIDLSHNRINYISSHAFQMRNSTSQEDIFIDLSGNQLNASSFATDSFTSDAKRPIKLTVNDNEIEYLDEKVFLPFLLSNIKNVIYILRNPIVCDCRMKWLMPLKQSYGQSQIRYMQCTNKDLMQFWSLTDDELNCEKS